MVADFNGVATETVVRFAARALAVFTNACLVAGALVETFLVADAFGLAFFGVIFAAVTVTAGTLAAGIAAEAALIFFFVACNCLRVD